MSWITIISIIFCISLFQTTILFHTSILGIQPDLFIIFLVYCSLNLNLERAFHANWATGLAKDIFSEGCFGLNTIIFVIVGYLISMIKDEIFRKHLVTQIVVTLIISIIYNFMYLFMLSFTLTSVSLLTMIWKCVIISVYNSIIVFPVFWLFDKTYTLSGISSLDRK
ncbi:MAG: rod shape-determining protein MreD [Candidatus Scalinduaceae bacterium]